MNSPPAPTFNLLHEPWIPVRPLDGSPVREVGLRELLLRARDFGRIDDPSPLVTVALLRLSLALLHRALRGPRNVEEAAEWFRNGFPAERLEAYFDEWEGSFDLFDAEHPFWQKRSDQTRTERYHWSLLTPELNGSNTTEVFGTKKRIEPLVPKAQIEAGLDAWLGGASPALVARLLVQNQGFALGGRTTGAAESQQGGPVMSKALFVAYGENLQETFCLNLLPYPEAWADVDRAVWEWQGEGADRTGGRNVPLGLADRYTWFSRGISIDFPDSETGLVKTVGYGAGLAREDDTNQGFLLEPMAALVSRKKDGLPILLPLGLSLNKLAWRDLSAILPEPQNQTYVDAKGKTIRVRGYAPPVVQNATAVIQSLFGDDADHYVLRIQVFGQILGRKPGITTAVRHEAYAMPIHLMSDWNKAGKHIYQAFKAAAIVALALEEATARLAAEVISRGGAREPHKNDVAALSRTLPGLGAYWAALEAPFRIFLAELDTPEDALGRWQAAVTREARRAWNLNLQGAGGDGQVLGFAYRPRRTDGRFSPSPQAILDRALKVLTRPQEATA